MSSRVQQSCGLRDEADPGGAVPSDGRQQPEQFVARLVGLSGNPLAFILHRWA